MEPSQLSIDLPYQVGALYNRQQEIHGRLGGQTQGGISTPANSPFVILFTGEAGKQHGYDDFWDDNGVLHYYGEGQSGDMQDKGGNRAVREHQQSGKRLLLFQMMGRTQPYRFLGEFRFRHAYSKDGVPDTRGRARTAIVFMLEPVEREFNPFQNVIADRIKAQLDLSATASRQLVEIRSKQSLFKRRLLTVEKKCRLSGIADLRFLRASHIKPWARCADGTERIDGSNGLLLSPHADFLFDRGWITFEDNGSLVRSDQLPKEVIERIGLDLTQGKRCGDFFKEQRSYLQYHRNAVFEHYFKKAEDPLSELLAMTIL
ncbi:putative C2H2 Zn-finger protein [Rhodanobacter sp. K2T2]|uniref:HNH endonuclease n=1 Tax=Rhodanobacter sp. K2T2 TaxID=2723085 RepID=UPI0015CAF7F4|nr:HNH endonuclease signature motif containing protein [Rhodanobacter sp. K2T2]NYE30389.1 putative C2H2 Zn-finger protein [Rhodanobacter sp. K2T2]